jgi:ABC-type branched-subunit amino acid transport system ATPase component/ABC-type branched-subunit amino acid transport system permease subunit
MAAVAVLVFYWLVSHTAIPWQLAAVVSVVILGPILGMAFELLARRLYPLPTESKILVTIGLVLFVQGIITLYSSDTVGPRLFAQHPALPSQPIHVFGAVIGTDEVIIVIASLLLAYGLHLFLARTRSGRVMRAVVDNADLVSLDGENPIRAQRWAWVLGIGLVALSGLLLVLSPSNANVSVDTLFLLVLSAFGAAAIGGFSNLPLTYAGGLLIGVAGALSAKYITEIGVLSGLPPSIPFVVLFLVLVLFPRHMAPERTIPVRPASARRVLRVPRWWRWVVIAIAVAALISVAILKNFTLTYDASEAVPYAVIFLGLGLLVRISGQVSLCQLGLAAVGATTFSHLINSFGFPYFLALIGGGLGGAIAGAAVALPAIRLSGVYLAVATFGFGILLEQIVYPTSLMFGINNGSGAVPRPIIGPLNAGNDVTFYVVLLVIFAACFQLTAMIRRARLGRLLRALGDSPTALQSQGTTTVITKVAAFAVSAFFAGIGGALLSSQQRFVVPDPFTPTNSLIVVVIVLTLRVAEPIASLAAAASFVLIPAVLPGSLPTWWLYIGFGVAAVAVPMLGTAAWLPILQWSPASARLHLPPLMRARHVQTRARRVPRGHPGGLEVRNLSIRYRGLSAVEDFSFAAEKGQITGLIGPNGAGKTSTLNFCSGLIRSKGRLILSGSDISHLGPAARARRGLGRTYQQSNLFDSLTVRQNVEMGREGRMAGAHVLRHVIAAPGEPLEARRVANEAMELTGVAEIADREVRRLSTAERRLVELARCLAGRFEFLLLDEPGAGLDSDETRRLSGVLRLMIAERGLGILLIEHNMALMEELCDHVYVLDFGHLIFSGTPTEVLQSEIVRSAYLGGDVTTVRVEP